MKSRLLLAFMFIAINACSQNDDSKNFKLTEKNKIDVRYKLFPTQNLWTFIKLDTRNGKLWQVQFDVKDINRFTTDLSTFSLVGKDEELNERFTLYPTQNMYNFILLDQIDGKTWQVQWSTDPELRGVVPIL